MFHTFFYIVFNINDKLHMIIVTMQLYTLDVVYQILLVTDHRKHIVDLVVTATS